MRNVLDKSCREN